ncbi:complex I subunit 5 family protein [Paramaledivibacter caminithermalis]|jgi:multicomponent Na+:H+ antiporter subunit D|uniref:Multisubunit sodium/proton antiporter, MrpD subunit n=1 Tax=Paramaledivibacter caminithermalis (strain DSM 15212 / CIP 107654 / DViRD3) TaxID=1121301 RepID=A0A1M6NZ71_PARC5|nr:proton-conducting transporter membrane subunit [Paramaledivibacter caminithermalis]SHK01019.1 multisubunit sodium/proton antiporter, MrpD subunit [Paramaledivibacter caminithermalis DSM 15212]
MDVAKNFPLVIILILFIGAFIMPLLKNKIYNKAFSLMTIGISSVLSLITLVYVNRYGTFLYRVGHWDSPWGIELSIGILEAIMSLLLTSVAFVISWYSVYTIEKEIKDNKVCFYYTLINILVGALLGIVYTNDLFNAFVFIEVSAIAACGIIVVKDKKENIKATLKYLILSSVGSGLVLMGIAFIYSITGNLNMTFINKELSQTFMAYENSILISLGLFTIGLGIKSAMYPLHVWLPDAHSNAPSTSSAMLSALVLKAYVIFYIKILYRMFGEEIISQFPILLFMVLILGSLGMIMGSILAILQKDIKRVIAYSSVAQMGYIFFGIGLGNTIGLVSTFFHILNHAIIKSALFLTVGSMIEKTGQKKLFALKGIGKEMPITLGLFTVSALSMVGIPILPGFISKFNFAIGSIKGGKSIFVVVILISSLLNALYYFPIVINGYFGEENLEGKVFKSKEKTIKELMPILVLIIAALILGASSNKIIEMISNGVEVF